MKSVFLALLFSTVACASGEFRAPTGAVIGPATGYNSAAVLDVQSTAKGFAPPRMTTAQMNAISSPFNGLVIFATDLKSLYEYNGSAWQPLISNGVFALTDGATVALDASLGNTFTLTSTQNPTINPPTNPTSGQKITIAFTAGGGSNRTLALSSSAGGFAFGSTITALATTTSAKTDYIGCIYNAANSVWEVVGYVQGY